MDSQSPREGIDAWNGMSHSLVGEVLTQLCNTIHLHMMRYMRHPIHDAWTHKIILRLLNYVLRYNVFSLSKFV